MTLTLLSKALVAAAAAFAALAPAASAAQPAAINGQIAFSGGAGGFVSSYAIRAINPDGSGSRTIGAGSGYDGGAAWSPDGNEIAYTRYSDGGIYVARADGTDERRITPAGKPGRAPTWSPDGSRLAYYRYNPSNASDAELWTINRDGTDDKRIDECGGFSQISWARTPAGERIAFVGGCNIDYGLRTTAPDGSGLVRYPAVYQLMASQRRRGGPDFSPDGTKLLFSSSETNGETKCGAAQRLTDIWVYELSSGSVTKLTNTTNWEGPHEVDPAWSPDGRMIVYSANTASCVDGRARYTQAQIHVANADGSNPRAVTANNDWAHLNPSWQPCRSGITRSCASTGTPSPAPAPSPIPQPPAPRPPAGAPSPTPTPTPTPIAPLAAVLAPRTSGTGDLALTCGTSRFDLHTSTGQATFVKQGERACVVLLSNDLTRETLALAEEYRWSLTRTFMDYFADSTDAEATNRWDQDDLERRGKKILKSLFPRLTRSANLIDRVSDLARVNAMSFEALFWLTQIQRKDACVAFIADVDDGRLRVDRRLIYNAAYLKHPERDRDMTLVKVWQREARFGPDKHTMRRLNLGCGPRGKAVAGPARDAGTIFAQSTTHVYDAGDAR